MPIKKIDSYRLFNWSNSNLKINNGLQMLLALLHSESRRQTHFAGLFVTCKLKNTTQPLIRTIQAVHEAGNGDHPNTRPSNPEIYAAFKPERIPALVN